MGNLSTEKCLGKRIRKAMFDKGLTIAEFADAIQCNRTNVYSIFNRYSLNSCQLMRISQVLGINFFKELSDETDFLINQKMAS